MADRIRRLRQSTLRVLATPLVYGFVALLASTVIVKRALAIESLGVDSWAPLLLALRHLAMDGADRLYDAVFFEQGIKFQYPPTSLLLAEVMDAAGYATTRVFNWLNLVALVGNGVVVGLLAYRLGTSVVGKEPARTAFGGALVMAMIYEPIVLAYAIGQIQVVINLFFSAACLAIVVGRNRMAGALIGVATIIKPQFGPLLLTQAMIKHWKFVVGMTAVLFVLGIASYWRYGWSSHWSYVEVLRFLSERGEVYHLNASLNGLAHRWLGNGEPAVDVETMGILQSVIPPYHATVAALTTMATVFFFAVPFVIGYVVRDADKPLMLCLGALCFVLGSPIAWIHHYGILLPMYVIALRAVLDYPSWALLRLALLAISFLATANRLSGLRDAQGLEVLFQPATFVFGGGCLLAAILSYEIYAKSRQIQAVVRPVGSCPPRISSSDDI